MPTSAPVACHCGKLNCTEHTAQKLYDRERAADPLRRLYHTRKWRMQTRPFILCRDKLCKIARICIEKFGEPAASTEVDHVISIRTAPHIDFFDESNLQGACHDCHSWKTATEHGLGTRDA